MNHIAGSADFAGAFAVSRETLERLEIYAALLLRWQRTINLVAPSTLGDVWHRHFADSAQLLALAPSGALRWVDLGSGGGFPGLVIGVMLAERRGSSLVLVESDGRKCAFLREVVRATGLAAAVDVDIVADRVESEENTTRVGHADVVSARALAPLDTLLGWCQPFFGPATLGLLPKGRNVAAEVAEARKRWRFKADLAVSRTLEDGRIVVLRGLQRV